MQDLKIFEEPLGDIGYSKGNTDVYASWTFEGVAYVSRGVIVDGLLEVSMIEDGVEEELFIDAPYVDEIIEAIKAYREKQYFDILKDELYKSYRLNKKLYHLSAHDLYFNIDGKHIKYKPTTPNGIYEVFEEIGGGQEVFIEYRLLEGSEYFKFIKDDIKKGEAE